MANTRGSGFSKLTSAGDLLQTLFGNTKSDFGGQFRRWRLWMQWSEIVGPEVSKHSEPVGYRMGRLYIWVDHPARLQEYQFIAGPLKDKINQKMGENWVRFIQFTVNRTEVPESARLRADLENVLSRPTPSEDEAPQPGQCSPKKPRSRRD